MDITGHPEGHGRMDRRTDWQFRQVVDAVHILYSMLEVPWRGRGLWRDSAHSLSPEHPPIARDFKDLTIPSNRNDIHNYGVKIIRRPNPNGNKGNWWAREI